MSSMQITRTAGKTGTSMSCRRDIDRLLRRLAEELADAAAQAELYLVGGAVM